MTDRVYALTVVLDNEYRTDDVETIINAIRMIKGVASVDASAHIARPADYIHRVRLASAMRTTLLDTIVAIFDPRQDLNEIKKANP